MVCTLVKSKFNEKHERRNTMHYSKMPYNYFAVRTTVHCMKLEFGYRMVYKNGFLFALFGNEMAHPSNTPKMLLGHRKTSEFRSLENKRIYISNTSHIYMLPLRRRKINRRKTQRKKNPKRKMRKRNQHVRSIS